MLASKEIIDVKHALNPTKGSNFFQNGAGIIVLSITVLFMDI